jgi:GntR family transcriptional regulator
MTELIRSPIPLYYQLQNIIREKIKNREFPADSKIPSEYDLCHMYNVSRQTVRHALKNLEDEGLINAVAGKGYFVSPTKKWFQFEWLVGTLEDLQSLLNKAKFVSLNNEIVEIAPGGRVAEKLSIKRREKVMCSKGLWSVQKDKISFGINFVPVRIPEKYGLKFRIDMFAKDHPSALNELLNHVWEARQYNIAKLADKEVSEVLGISEGEPVLLLERTYLSKEEEPMMFVQVYYPSMFYTHIHRFRRNP